MWSEPLAFLQLLYDYTTASFSYNNFFSTRKKIQDAFISLFENSYNPTTLLEKNTHILWPFADD